MRLGLELDLRYILTAEMIVGGCFGMVGENGNKTR